MNDVIGSEKDFRLNSGSGSRLIRAREREGERVRGEATYVRVREDELAQRAVKRVAVHAVAGRQH